ncbi:hypothetical protein [Enterococcus sp. AZ196]|uniref:hypothetical protein n=1 Tax=Enterococcus sp. AZ196 TaxID=2774659 RepID=UPI003D2B4089
MDKLDELWKEQEQLIEDVDFVLEAFKEGTAIFKDVTKKFPTIEAFIGQSTLETADGLPGYTMQGIDDQTIFVQFFSGDKQLCTHLKDGKIVKHQYLVIDNKLDTPTKRLEHFTRKIHELKELQKKIDELEKEQTDE